MRHRVVLLGLALLVLAGCASEAQRHYAEELCIFRERKDPEIVAYTNPKDQSLLGEPDAEVYEGETGQIASAIATAREPVYRYEERRDCYDKAGDFYYPCIQKFEVELGQVKAVGRALTLEKAETLARNLCQRKVNDIVEKKVGRPQESMATKCIVQHSQFCALPPATPAAAAPAARK